MSRAVRFALAVALLLLTATYAWGRPQLTLQIEDSDIYTDLPFTLLLRARDFEETPQPAPPDLTIDGAEVTYLGVSPNVSEQITIINGRRSEFRQVTFVYRWRVQVSRAGSHQIPVLTVTQGSQSATSRPAQFTAKDIESTQYMIVRLQLPDRPVWVGETFDVEVEWMLAQDVENFEFVVPLFGLDQVRVEAPDSSARTVEFPAGAQNISLPMIRDDVSENGTRYARFRFPARVTVNRPGPLDLAPIRVVADLESGSYRDRFGFRRAQTKRFKAVGERERLVVRALPIANRPAGFVNAIGTGFSISVRASRTVVQVGDPIELNIQVRGDGELEGLSLPALGGSAGLPPALFSVPGEADVGVIDEQANTKTFTATVRVRSAEAREVPPLDFAYFDPTEGQYITVSSRPIALSVGGTNVVGIEDVIVSTQVAANVATNGPQSAAPAGSRSLTSLIGADMALSAPGQTLATAWRPDELRSILFLLYVLPVLVAVILGWLSRTGAVRTRRRSISRASRAVIAAVRRDAPARESAPVILAALRSLARTTGRQHLLRSDLIARLENSAYDPDAADQPIDHDTRDAVLSLAADISAEAPPAVSPAAMASFFVVFAALILLGGANDSIAGDSAIDTALPIIETAPSTIDTALPNIDTARSSINTARSSVNAARSSINTARSTYAAALDEPDRVRRMRLFKEAEQQFRNTAEAHPGAASLQADWGNAALGAQDIGHAVLAYRRALRVDPGEERAARNLAWLRDRFPVWLPRPSNGGALDTLLFWEQDYSVSDRYLIGAVAFALAVLLAMPLPFAVLQSRRKVRRRVALLAGVIWLAATASAWFGSSADSDAVVIIDSSALRSADSLGAPLAFANPLPAGTEVAILEDRNTWVRVALADGSRGWMTASAVENVAHRLPTDAR